MLKNCSICKKKFEPKFRSSYKFCSDKCKRLNYLQKKREERKRFYLKHKDKLRREAKILRQTKYKKYNEEYRKKYNAILENKVKKKEYNIEYRTDPKNKDKYKKYSKIYRNKPEKKIIIKKGQKRYRIENKDFLKEKWKIWAEANKEKLNAKAREWAKKPENKLKINKRLRIYMKDRKHNDPIFKLKGNVRSRISIYLRNRNIKKFQSSWKLVGCTTQKLRTHIEKQFKPGMTWKNYKHDGWHVDHIIPISRARTKEEIYRLCHYTNLQPLWAKENIRKSNKY